MTGARNSGLVLELRRGRRGDRDHRLAFGAVSEIVLPLFFAAVLAVSSSRWSVMLERRGLKPRLGAGLVVLGLLALMVARRGRHGTRRGRADGRDQ